MASIATDILKRFLPLWVVSGVGAVCLAVFIVLAKHSDAARQNFYKVKKELGLYRTGIWHLEKLNLEALNKQVERLSVRFPSSENLSAVIGEIAALAENYGVEITSITPSEKVEIRDEKKSIPSVLDRVPVEMKLEGSYGGLARFLSELSALEHGVLTADRFQLGKETAESTNLTLPLSASIYVRRTPEQDILNERIPITAPPNRESEKSRFGSIERDPFTKKVIGEGGESVINLEGIIYDPAQPIILVNGETKGVGDRVGDMRILEIQPDSVLFDKKGKQVKMRLQQD